MGSESGQRRKVEVGMWMGLGLHAAETWVSTGIYGGIRRLISQGTNGTHKAVPSQRTTQYEAEIKRLVAFTLNGNNISNVEVNCDSLVYLHGILASRSRLKKY